MQVEALNQANTQTFQAERDAQEKWSYLRQIEESFFKQKSKVHWLGEGDQNTSFFHRSAEVRNSINAIRSFTVPDGSIEADPGRMSSLAMLHFRNIMAPDQLLPLLIPFSWFQDMIRKKCSRMTKQTKIQFPSSKEIQKVLLKMN